MSSKQKVLVVGGSGFLGSELMRVSENRGYATTGSFTSNPLNNGIHINLDEGEVEAFDSDAWDYTIWSATGYKDSGSLFRKIIKKPNLGRIVYVSSDVLLCEKTRQASSELGKYAMQKLNEEQEVCSLQDYVVFRPGPISGANSNGVNDARLEKLLGSNEVQSLWGNVYKTFSQVQSLGRLIVSNLDIEIGVYLAGPDERLSYYDHFVESIASLKNESVQIEKTEATDEELDNLGICYDTSFVGHDNRIWIDSKL